MLDGMGRDVGICRQVGTSRGRSKQLGQNRPMAGRRHQERRIGLFEPARRELQSVIDMSGASNTRRLVVSRTKPRTLG